MQLLACNFALPDLVRAINAMSAFRLGARPFRHFVVLYTAVCDLAERGVCLGKALPATSRKNIFHSKVVKSASPFGSSYP